MSFVVILLRLKKRIVAPQNRIAPVSDVSESIDLYWPCDVDVANLARSFTIVDTHSHDIILQREHHSARGFSAPAPPSLRSYKSSGALTSVDSGILIWQC